MPEVDRMLLRVWSSSSVIAARLKTNRTEIEEPLPRPFVSVYRRKLTQVDTGSTGAFL
jgi:hypothetical protein